MRVFTLALLTLLVAMSAAAIPLPITIQDAYGGTNPQPPNPTANNGDVLGLLKDFDIDYVKFTVVTAVEVQALIHVNYNHGATSPLDLDTWDFGTKHLNSGDLLFDVGTTYKYAVPIVGHDLLTAGALYSITNVPKTSNQVYGSGGMTGIPVWMDPAGSNKIGNNIALTWTLDGAPSVAGILTLRFTPTAGFLTDLASTGLSVHYASATCANDYLDGRFQYAIPEPMSMLLMGGGLVGLGLFGRRRLLRRR